MSEEQIGAASLMIAGGLFVLYRLSPDSGVAYLENVYRDLLRANMRAYLWRLSQEQP